MKFKNFLYFMAISLLVEGAYANPHPNVELINNTGQLVDLSVTYQAKRTVDRLLKTIYPVDLRGGSDGDLHGGVYIRQFMCPNQRYEREQKIETPNELFGKHSLAETDVHINVGGVNRGNCHIKTEWKEKVTKKCWIHMMDETTNKVVVFTAEAVFAGGNYGLRSVTISSDSNKLSPPPGYTRLSNGLCGCNKVGNKGVCVR